MTAANMLCVMVPVKIISESNTRSHWRQKAARAKEQRTTAWVVLRKHPAPGDRYITITLSRIGPRKLDDDNLASGFKAVRDGVADWLGIDDGDKRLTWRYEQRKSEPWTYSAEIRVEWEA